MEALKLGGVSFVDRAATRSDQPALYWPVETGGAPQGLFKHPGADGRRCSEKGSLGPGPIQTQLEVRGLNSAIGEPAGGSRRGRPAQGAPWGALAKHPVGFSCWPPHGR